MLISSSKALFLPAPLKCCQRCFCTSTRLSGPKHQYTRAGDRIPARPGARYKPYAINVEDDGPLPLTDEQKAKIEEARTQRAERQERMDITAALSPVKTYMGGFTVPKKLRTLDRIDTHFYTKRPRPERKPPADAYTPHCVFGFLSRHPVWAGHGVAIARVIETGMCAEKDFKQVLAHYNGAATRPSSSSNEDNDEEADKEEEAVEAEEALEDAEDDQPLQLKTGLEGKQRKFSNLTRKQKKKERAKVSLPYIPASKSLPPMAKPARIAAMNAIWGGPEWVLQRNELRLNAEADHQAYLASLPPNTFPPPEYQRPHIPEKKNAPWPVWTDQSPHLPLAVPLPPYTDPPFFTPLFLFTFSTRPLAGTIKRLQAGLQRGLPYYAAVPNQDRKDGPSFFRRKLRMRIDRLQRLIRHMAKILSGEEGGFVGIRFHQDDLGRSLNGERMNGIEMEKRRIEVRWGDEAIDLLSHGRGWEGVAEGWEGIPELYWGRMDEFGNLIGECEGVPGAEEREGYLKQLEEEKAKFAYTVEMSAVSDEVASEFYPDVSRKPVYTEQGRRETQQGMHWVVRRTVPNWLRERIEGNQTESWDLALKTLRSPTSWTGKPEGREDDPEWAADQEVETLPSQTKNEESPIEQVEQSPYTVIPNEQL